MKRKFSIKFLVKCFFLLDVLLILLAVLIAYSDGQYVNIRNYHGYCTSPSYRYDKKYLLERRLTTEERLDIAIDRYLRNQSMDYQEIWKAERGERWQNWEFTIPRDLEERFTLIPYADKEEFLQANPGCCKRSWGLAEGDQFGCRERADGAGDGMFNFKHKVRYIDQEGVRKEIETTNSYISVNNCGYARPRVHGGEVVDISKWAKGCK